MSGFMTDTVNSVGCRHLIKVLVHSVDNCFILFTLNEAATQVVNCWLQQHRKCWAIWKLRTSHLVTAHKLWTQQFYKVLRIPQTVLWSSLWGEGASSQVPKQTQIHHLWICDVMENYTKAIFCVLTSQHHSDPWPVGPHI